MADVKLRVESLLDAAKKIEDAAVRIDKAVGRIDSEMSDIDAVWSDQNSKQYIARYEELKQDFPAFKQAAHDYSAFLNSVVEEYRKEFFEPTSTSVRG